jgi:hypothetical protein
VCREYHEHYCNFCVQFPAIFIVTFCWKKLVENQFRCEVPHMNCCNGVKSFLDEHFFSIGFLQLFLNIYDTLNYKYWRKFLWERRCMKIKIKWFHHIAAIHMRYFTPELIFDKFFSTKCDNKNSRKLNTKITIMFMILSTHMTHHIFSKEAKATKAWLSVYILVNDRKFTLSR